MRLSRAVLLCSAFALAVVTSAQVHTVTRVGLVAKPPSYGGPCPATLHFIGTIHVSRHPATVEYEWERSDGAKGPRQRITVRSASQSVHDTWTLGAHGVRENVWERLHVLAPTGIESPIAHAHIDCR